MKGPEPTELILCGPDCGMRETRRTLRWSSRAFFRVPLLVVVCALALFAGGFVWFAVHVSRLATPENPAEADAIIVLTGGQARLNAAIDLLKSGKGQRLLISGVSTRSGT